MLIHLIPIYFDKIKEVPKYKRFRYNLQHMGICEEALYFHSSNNTKKEIKKEILNNYNNLGIKDVMFREFSDEYIICIALLQKKWNPDIPFDNKKYKIRYFLNFYSPWFSEDENISNLEEEEFEETNEEINICDYVMDTCDNHHCYNNHLKTVPIKIDDKKTITIYSIMQLLT